MRASWVPAVIAIAVAMLVAYAGARATQLGRWYRELRKPKWQPPDFLFGPVWTTVYSLCVWSALTAWPLTSGTGRVWYLAGWALNLVLNVMWSVLFFRRQRPDWALVEVVGLWSSIVLLLVISWQITPRAGLLLLPYLIWVSFASVLNIAIVRLNAPFTRT